MVNYRELIEHIGEGTFIADGVEILRSGSRYLNRGIIIGDHCYIHSGSRFILGALDGMPCTDIFVGNFVIEEDFWIGGGSVILQGIRLGKGCVIGGGTTVVKDVPAYAVVGGNPARVMKW